MPTTTTTKFQLRPYIFFYGRCEEAIEFYKKALGGTCEFQRMGDSNMAADMPAEAKNKVMHGSFTAPGIEFFVSDGRDSKSIDPEAGNISLSLNASDAAEGERIFKALSEGGTVTMPYEDAPWGEGKFGVVHDRFGNEWMITNMPE
jgi:PhnB protein